MAQLYLLPDLFLILNKNDPGYPGPFLQIRYYSAAGAGAAASAAFASDFCFLCAMNFA
jgi:hypothetical protein